MVIYRPSLAFLSRLHPGYKWSVFRQDSREIWYIGFTLDCLCFPTALLQQALRCSFPLYSSLHVNRWLYLHVVWHISHIAWAVAGPGRAELHQSRASGPALAAQAAVRCLLTAALVTLSHDSARGCWRFSPVRATAWSAAYLRWQGQSSAVTAPVTRHSYRGNITVSYAYPTPSKENYSKYWNIFWRFAYKRWSTALPYNPV